MFHFLSYEVYPTNEYIKLKFYLDVNSGLKKDTESVDLMILFLVI